MSNKLAFLSQKVAPGIAAKAERLCRTIESKGSLAVAWSGGIDSSLLVFFAASVLKERALAVVFSTTIQPDDQLPDVEQFVREVRNDFGFDIPTKIVHANEFVDIDNFGQTREMRCYFCMGSKYTALRRIADASGIEFLADGAQASDLGAFNPWLRAAGEQEICHPLVEAGITKADVQDMSAALGLPTASKVSAPCLTSRVPFCQDSSPAKLARVRRAESLIRKLAHIQGYLRCRDWETVSNKCFDVCPFMSLPGADLRPMDCATGFILSDPSQFGVILVHKRVIVETLQDADLGFIALDLCGTSCRRQYESYEWTQYGEVWVQIVQRVREIERRILCDLGIAVAVDVPIGQTIARIETSNDGAKSILRERKDVVRGLKALGYQRVSLDLMGYRYDGANSPKVVELLVRREQERRFLVGQPE